MLTKTLKILYILLFFFTPLIMFRDTSELFEFNKMLFIYAIAVLVLFFWVLKMIVYKKIIVNKTPFFLVIALFLFSQFLSTLFSIDVHTSVFGYYGRFNGGLISIIAYLVLFFGFVSNFNKKFVLTILKTSLLSSLLVILWGLPGKFGFDLSCFVFTGQLSNDCWTDQFRPAERMFSTLGQPNWLGAYLAINFFIGLYFLLSRHLEHIRQAQCKLRERSSEQRERKHAIARFLAYARNDIGYTKYLILYTLYLVFNFSAILFTRSRSALLAIGMSFILLLIYKPVVYLKRKFLFNNKRIVLTGFVLVFGIITAGFNLINSINVGNGLDRSLQKQTTNKITPSSEIRKIVWTASIDLIKRYPLFGTGVETFGYAYFFVRPLEHNLTSEWDYLYNKAHNEYLNYLATTGIFGFGTYILLILSVIWLFLRNVKLGMLSLRRQGSNYLNADCLLDSRIRGNDISRLNILHLCLFLSFVTILITNFFGFSITVINLYFFLIPAFIVALNNSFADEDNQRLNKLTNKQKIAIGVSALFTCYLLLSLFLYFIADLNYAKSNNSYRASDYQGAYQSLNTALNLRYEHVYQDKISYILANLAYLSASDKKDDLAKKEIMLSEFYNLKSIEASPLNVLYWKTRSKNAYLFYQITQDKKYLDIGIEALDKAFGLSPSDPKIPYSKALFYSVEADDENDKTKKNNDEKLSLKEIDNSIKLKSDFSDAYFFKGQLLKKYGQKEEAKKVFQFILDNFNPDDQDVKKELNSL